MPRPSRLRVRGWVAALFLSFLCWLSATADTILDYTPPDYAYGEGPASPGVSVTYASGFKVGSQEVEITAISFRLDALSDVMTYDFTAYLFATSLDRPGTLMGSSHRFFDRGDINPE